MPGYVSHDMAQGLPYGDVEVVASEPDWQADAAASIVEIRAALARSAMAIEHVGSTAVQGLPAKPIIDLAVALHPMAEIGRVVTAMEAIGYVPRGQRLDVGDWLFHRLSDNEWCTTIVHAVAPDNESWDRWLRVRDRLRADPAARDEYAALKQSLAELFPHDRASYSRGKAAFLRNLVGDV